MKKILFIAPSCIPIVGSEAIVNIKLLKVLSQGGVRIDVVSRLHNNQLYPDVGYEQYGIKIDNLHIVETDSRLNLKTIWLHVKAFLLFGVSYRGAHWACMALPFVLDLVKNNEYDAVITKDLPGELLGSYLKKKKGLKWIATWNDPFPIEKYPFPYGKGVNATLPLFARRLIYLMRCADYQVFPSGRLRDYMLQYLLIQKDKTMVIPHVTFNPLTNLPHRDNRILRIVHTGNLSNPRNPNHLIQAFSKFILKHPNATIQLDFVGATNNVLELSNEYNVGKYIKVLPPMPYDKTQELLRNYHIALIVEAPCSEGVFLPTKVGDAMQCGVDIFAISPAEGVLNDLYREKHIGYFADVTQVGEIENLLEIIWMDFMQAKIKVSTIPEAYTPAFIFQQYKRMIG